MSNDKEYIYSKEVIESIIANPENSWKTKFKETIISMIASNKNELLWYSNFLSRCEYEFHFNESFVSSVYFNGKNFVIVINPLILGSVHKDQVIAILKHNAGHIINQHFKRTSKDSTTNKEIIDIAKDIVINGDQDIPYINDLPRTGNYKDSSLKTLFYQVLNQKYGIDDYEIGREFEYYVDLMNMVEEDSQEEIEESDQSCSNDMEDDSEDDTNAEEDSNEDGEDTEESIELPENGEEDETDDRLNLQSNAEDYEDENNESSNNEENSSLDEANENSVSLSEKTMEALNNGEISIDSHEFGEQLQESVGLDNDLLNSFMDTTLNELINESTDFARGFTPSEAIEAQNRIEKRKSHKDWKKIFNKKMRNFLTNSIRYRELNKTRQHPIYQDDLDLYGYSPGKKPKLAVVLDVSGSVNDKLLSALMSEVQAIQKKYSIKSITLVQVDAEIKSIEKFEVNDKFIVRHGGGGTVMEPGFKKLLHQPSREIPDIIICATDGDIEEKFEQIKLPNKVQVIWLVSKEGKLLFDVSRYSKKQMSVIKFSV